MDSPEIDETAERENNFQTDDDNDMVTFPVRTTTNIPTKISGYSPKFTKPNELNKLVLKPSGNMIKLKCAAKGEPEPTIEWTKDGRPIERTMGQVQQSKWAIMLEDSIPVDSGSYSCKVCNIHGCISHTSKVEVNGKC